MKGRDLPCPDDQPATQAEGIAAVKSPPDVGSSPARGIFPPRSSPTFIGLPSDAPTIVEGPFPGNTATSQPSDLNNPTLLQLSTVLGGRYEILQLLGEGGMGAVYRAQDREVNRTVALKVIRPDLAGNPAILERFRQELVLSHQVTHKNVVRIYDLGNADGIRFITMEYIEGQDLRSLIIQKKVFAPQEAVGIMGQVCRALEAAHAVGVIHRDLKPQNIMRDEQGRVVVMDFGLARLLDSHHGMTQTGAIVGTMEYMSPEQGLGKPLDERSDLFAVGLIFYELLTGKMPYKADSALASLLKRTHERATPVSDDSPSIPRALSDIVSKCLELKVEDRYQHVSEILTDLEAFQGGRAAATLNFHSSSRPWGQSLPWHWIGGFAAVLVLAIAGFLLRNELFRSPTARAPSGPVVSLAILPFHNASSDPSLDWLGSSLSQMLTTDVGQSSGLRTVSPNQLNQVLADLHLGAGSTLDPSNVGRVAEFSNADTVVWGQYAKFGDQIRIDATLEDLKHDRRVVLKASGDEQQIPKAIDQLADSIRQHLSVSTDVIKELQASSFQPSSKSISALRNYNQAVLVMRSGKSSDALNFFQAASKDDPNFALAFSKMAETYSLLGYDHEAEDAARKAVEKSGNLPASERYLITASQFQILKDYPRAIDAYMNLAKAAPNNSDVQSALASVYENSGDFAKAREFCQKLLVANPRDITALLAIGRVEILSGNPQASFDPLNRGLALAIELDNQEQKAMFLHLLGAAYGDLNKPDEALQYYQQALEIKRRLGQKKGLADSLNMVAETYDILGKSDLAFKNYNEALRIYREIGDNGDTGNVLLNLGQFDHDRGKYDEALQLFKESLQIQREVHNQNYEGMCLNNIGNTYLAKSDYDNARIYFEQALKIREKIDVPSDIAQTLHNLGEVSTKSGQFEQALRGYERALELYRKAADKHGAAVESYSMGTIFEYEGRYGSAMSSKKQALDDLRGAQENGFWAAEALSGYGNSLSAIGRFEEGAKTLDEAVNIARSLKNDALVGQALNWQGDNFFYRGDFKSATSSYEQAMHIGLRSTDRSLVLSSKMNLAKSTVKAGHPQIAILSLTGISNEAASLGLKYLSIQSAIYEAEARIQMKDYSRARLQLDRTIMQSESLGIRPLLLKAHFLLGRVLADMNTMAEASHHYKQALDVLEEIRKDPGAGGVMQRADFKEIYTESANWIRQHP